MASAAIPSPIVPSSVSSWTRAAYEDLDSADEPAELEDALLMRLQAERNALLLVLGLGALSSQQMKRLNAVLDEREAILDRRERLPRGRGRRGGRRRLP